MTVELTRRLIESGVPLSEIEAALLRVVERGLSLPEALLDLDPALWERVEQELLRADLPSVLTVRASPELCARLPEGMCRRLMAVPVHVDPRSGRIDVAAAEPLDWHLGQEFGFHFGQPIRVLQASPEAVRVALDRLQQATKVSVLPPREHSDAPIPLVKGEPSANSDAPIPLVRGEVAARSDAPIPLVRRSLVPGRSPSVVPRSVRPSAPQPTGLNATDGAAASWRSKPPPVDLIEGAARLEHDARAADRKPTPVAPAPAAAELLEAATTPEDVLAVLRDCLAPVHSIVFAIKNASFDGRVASVGVEQRTKARQLTLLAHQPSVLETATKSGFYLGPIPNTPNHRELREALMPDAANEVYVTVVSVSDRPSLVWLLAGFEQSLDLTRRADEIALAAGRALGRILRQRKRGS